MCRYACLLTAAVATCVLGFPLTWATTQPPQHTAVCADLVGAGGVGVRVWPTIRASPQRHTNKLLFRLLQINWDAEEIQEGDWVGVFQQDPRPPHTRPPPTTPATTPHRFWQMPRPLHWDTPYASRGTITTNITQPKVELSMLARGGCVGVYVAFVRNGVCVASECIAAHPSWLFDNRQVVGNRSLRSLVLPGTHNAGSYSLLDRGDVVSAWVVCQDEDVVSQLLYGNRYLDLRVAYYPDTSELLWINHDLVRWRPLLEVLNDVRGFLAISPDPVIIDVHRTPVGFELPEALPLLLSLMNETLGSHFLHNRYGSLVSLDQIWKIGKRVIFSFADADVADKQDWVWPPLPQAWANAQLLDDLRTYLDAQMNKRVGSPRLWAAMAHLTPTLWDVILRSHVGIRGLADRVNSPVSRWLRQRWAHMANIIASDFFRGNDIINVAIRTNLALSVCRPPQARRPVIPVVPVTPQRHPVTFRRSTGFRIVAETRRPVYSEITTQPMTSSTTLPPLLSRIYSPASAEDSASRSSSSLKVAVHEGTKYNGHSSTDSTVEVENAQSNTATDSSLHPLIRILVSPTDSATSKSSENAGQHKGNRWSDHVDYTGVAYETSEELLYISEPKISLYDTISEQDPPAESQGPTEPQPVSIDFNAAPVKPWNETDIHSESDFHNAGGWHAETSKSNTTNPVSNETAPRYYSRLDISEAQYLSNLAEDWELQGSPFNKTVQSYVTISSTTKDADETMQSTETTTSLTTKDADETMQSIETNTSSTTKDADQTMQSIETTTSSTTKDADQTMQSTETTTSSTTKDADQTMQSIETTTSSTTKDADQTMQIIETTTSLTTKDAIQKITSHIQIIKGENTHLPVTKKINSVSVDINKSNSSATQFPEHSSLEHFSTQNFFLELFSAQTPKHLSNTQTPEHFSPQIQDELSTHKQTSEHFSTQTPENLSTQTKATEQFSTQTKMPEHFSTQKQNTKTQEHFSTQTQTKLSTQTQATKQFSTQTPEHRSTQTQAQELLSTQTQVTEHFSTQTPQHFSIQNQHFSTETSHHFLSPALEHFSETP